MYTIKEIAPHYVGNCDIENPYIVVDTNGMDACGEAMEKDVAQQNADELNQTEF